MYPIKDGCTNRGAQLSVMLAGATGWGKAKAPAFSPLLPTEVKGDSTHQWASWARAWGGSDCLAQLRQDWQQLWLSERSGCSWSQA